MRDRFQSDELLRASLLRAIFATHALTKSEGPRTKPPYPSKKLFPSPYLYLGDGNMFWLDMHDFEADALKAIRKRDGEKCYDGSVAGLLVLDTLASARAFLIEDKRVHSEFWSDSQSGQRAERHPYQSGYAAAPRVG